MASLFHVPTALALLAAILGVRRHRDVKVWLLGACTLLFVGLMGMNLSYGTSFFAQMRGSSWLLFVYGPLYAFCTAGPLAPGAPHLARLLRLAAGGSLAIGIWAFGVEPTWLEVSRFTVESNKVDRPLRIAVLTDLQTDHVGDHERRAFEAVMAEEPDLILMPGDYLQVRGRESYLQEAEKLRAVLLETGFSAPLGVFAVRGDVEGDGWERLFEGTGIHTSEKTTRIELPELVITALSPRDARLRRAWPRRTEKFHLTFGHAPEFALDQEQLDKPSADLSVAGHTHGGQVRLPFIGPLVTLSSIPRSWAAGRTDFANGGTLIVSRGVGMERGRAPRLRFLCRPEIAIIDVVPSVASPEQNGGKPS